MYFLGGWFLLDILGSCCLLLVGASKTFQGVSASFWLVLEKHGNNRLVPTTSFINKRSFLHIFDVPLVVDVIDFICVLKMFLLVKISHYIDSPPAPLSVIILPIIGIRATLLQEQLITIR